MKKGRNDMERQNIALEMLEQNSLVLHYDIKYRCDKEE